MKKCTLVFIMVMIACDHELPEKSFNDPDWIKLEIPNAREAYAIAGNIDDTLLVGALYRGYYTADQGKTWHESYDFSTTVSGLLERNDSIFTLFSRVTYPDGSLYASSAYHFTKDHGHTWNRNIRNLHVQKRIGSVISTSNVEYFLKVNTTPVSPGSTTSWINPTDIMRMSSAGAEPIAFPYKHNILNLHMDSNDRLYIAASGGRYVEANNTFECCDDLPAIIYVSKRPMN